MSSTNSSASEGEGASSATTSRLATEAKSFLPPRRREPQDITHLFTKHASALPSGHLIKDDFFTLFEAVGALEIMDPKMDSGFVPEGDTFDPEFDVERGLDGGEVLGIMEGLLSAEVEWLEGSPLSQTVFVNLHVSRLIEPGNLTGAFRVDGTGGGGKARETDEEVLTHEVLRAYCVGVVKCLELSLQVIQGQTFYEEEDFVTHLFGRELLPKITADEALQMLMEAKMRLADLKSLSTEMKEALEFRIDFREQMLDALRGDEECWGNLPDCMAIIQSSHHLATSVSNAFSAKMQRQLATSTPPRPMLNVPWDEAVKKWRHLISNAIETYRIAGTRILSDPQHLQRAVWTFASRNPPPSTLPRALLQDALFHEQGPVATGVGHYELFLFDLKSTVLAGSSLVDPSSFQIELPSDPRHIRARLLEGFIEKAFDEYLNLYRMVCQNRCRIRRLFTQAVGIWDAMESEGARVDRAMVDVPVLGKGKGGDVQKDAWPLSSWAKMYKLRIMAWTVQMGFETEIYMNDELGNMYHFLSHICTLLSQLTQHITTHLKDRMNRKPTSMSDCLASQAYLHYTRLPAEITQAMASALSTFFFHLQNLGLIATPRRDFSKAQLFYEARMKPYLSVANDRIPSTSDFEAARAAHGKRTTGEVCQTIDTEIKRAKTLLGELKRIKPEDGKFVGSEERVKAEVKALETTCVAVAVNASQLGRLGEKFAGEELAERVEVGMERRWSEWWVVPVVKEKK